MVLTAMLGVVATGVLFRVQAQLHAAGAAGTSQQARLAAMSGIQQALAVLARDANQETWWNNESLFRDQLVADDGVVRWHFTIWAPGDSEEDGIRYGLMDEGGRINVNGADANALRALAGMSRQVADAIVDYRDADDEVSPEGAEQDAYDRLACPYLIRNGPLATVEELLLVLGVDAARVYGEDANLNGLLDANENDGDEHFPPDNRDGRLDAGLAGILTTWSTERRARSSFNINGDLRGIAHTRLTLPARTKRFIWIYRNEGNRFSGPLDLVNMRYDVTQDYPSQLRQPALTRGESIISGITPYQSSQMTDLLEAGPEAPADPNALDPNAPNPNAPDPNALDPNTPGSGAAAPAIRPGRLNVNTAPAGVLARLPGMDQAMARQIVDARRTISPQEKTSTHWLVTNHVLDPHVYNEISPLLTTESRQYRVRVVGYGLPAQGERPPSYCVLEAVLDLGGEAPRIVYLRDLTRLGLPFAVGGTGGTL